MDPLKVVIVFFYLTRKVELCYFLLTDQVYNQKAFNLTGFKLLANLLKQANKF